MMPQGEIDTVEKPSQAVPSPRRRPRPATQFSDAHMRARITTIALIGFFSTLAIITLSILLKITDYEIGIRMLTAVATAGSGIVGTIVGYFFGKRD